MNNEVIVGEIKKVIHKNFNMKTNLQFDVTPF